MAVAGAQTGERYTIRQKIFKIFGNRFHIYGEGGELVGYCAQKAFRFREDIRFFTDESMGTELFSMKARTILDFSTTYDVALPTGETLGSLRRKGFKSMIRDEWMVFDESGADLGRIREDSTTAAVVRRLFEPAAMFMPQKFHVEDLSGASKAIFRTHFNPFVYRLGITVVEEDERFDDILILACACLIATIEGRQSGGSGGTGLFSGD
ncbi:MAG: hypothetical protein AAFR38_04815 [Planctomycetota bacterium]